MTSNRFAFIQTTPIYNRAQDQLYVLQKKHPPSTYLHTFSLKMLFPECPRRRRWFLGCSKSSKSRLSFLTPSIYPPLIFLLLSISHIHMPLLCKDLSHLLHDEELQGHSPQIQLWLQSHLNLLWFFFCSYRFLFFLMCSCNLNYLQWSLWYVCFTWPRFVFDLLFNDKKLAIFSVYVFLLHSNFVLHSYLIAYNSYQNWMMLCLWICDELMC